MTGAEAEVAMTKLSGGDRSSGTGDFEFFPLVVLPNFFSLVWWGWPGLVSREEEN